MDFKHKVVPEQFTNVVESFRLHKQCIGLFCVSIITTDYLDIETFGCEEHPYLLVSNAIDYFEIQLTEFTNIWTIWSATVIGKSIRITLIWKE